MKVIQREPSNTLERTELWTVQPDRQDHKYLISITKPLVPAERPHGMILTDGNMVVGTAMQLMTFLEMGTLAPPNVIVTIGFPLDNPVPHIVARNRILTPTGWPEWDAAYGRVLKLGCPASGDSDAFRAFIIEELKPAIESEFGVDPQEWTIGGHSLGRLFATHTLLAAPTAFKRYFAVESSFWWQKPLMFDLAKAFAAQATKHDISIYLSIGDKESGDELRSEWAENMKTPEWRGYIDAMGGFPDLVQDTHEMAAILASCAGMRVKAETIPNETHGSAVFVALSQGLRWLYAK